MRLGIDLDGVTADFVGAAAQAFDFDPQQVDTWNGIFEQAGLTPQKFFGWCRVLGVFAKCEPLPGAVEGIKELIAEGHEIHFVTHRPDWARPETHLWLARHLGVKSYEIHMSAGEQKGDTCCDVYLDDSPHVLKDLYGEGHYTVRFRQPWNMDSTDWDYTVADWPSFVFLIKQISHG